MKYAYKMARDINKGLGSGGISIGKNYILIYKTKEGFIFEQTLSKKFKKFIIYSI